MEYRELQYLMTLAETRNMTRAAEKLFISQSALSHYLRCVEEELGVRLFDRSTSPMTLTPAGRCYIDSARAILLENDRLKKELRDITRHMSGKLVIGTSRDRASYMIPRILPEFTERYPGIETQVFTASGQKLFEALREGRVDMVMLPIIGQVEEKGVCAEPIYTEELVLAARAGTIQESDRTAGGRAVIPESLDQKPFYLLFQEHVARDFCDRFFRKEIIHPEIRMEFSSNITCLCMAATGMGLAIVPYLTTQLVKSGQEIELFSLGRERQIWEIEIFYRKGAYLGEPELSFMEIAKRRFSHESLRW